MVYKFPFSHVMFHLYAKSVAEEKMQNKYLYATADDAKKKYATIKFINRDEPLGSGHFGKVFAAKYVNKDVAVKEMSLTPKYAVMLLMFNREVGFMRKLRHPNILTLVDGFQLNLDKYIVITEICNGGELFDAIVSKGHLLVSDARRVAGDVLSAIKYMHDMNVVHRDLKPENILLSSKWEKGPIPSVKVIDLGLAADWKEKLLTKFVGTPYYIAPEIIQTERREADGYNKAVDIWSFGVIMYILLCGYPPFVADDKQPYERILNATLDFHDDPGEAAWTVVPDTTVPFIRRLLNRNISERLTARQALDDPFMSEMESSPVDTIVKINNLRKFVDMSKVKRLLRYEIAQNLSVVEQKRYMSEFRDKSMNKSIAVQKLRKYFKNYSDEKIIPNRATLHPLHQTERE